MTTQPFDHIDSSPRALVIGVGGGALNAVDHMINVNPQRIEFMVADTDRQRLGGSRAAHCIQIGPDTSRGFGMDTSPDDGRVAAEAAANELRGVLDGAHLVFIIAGMGGGTGTGAATVIARMAKQQGVFLTVGVVTMPFGSEGSARTRVAEKGAAELQQNVDTLIVIRNEKLLDKAPGRAADNDAFKMVDHTIYGVVRGIVDLLQPPNKIGTDLSDIATVLANKGRAGIGLGQAAGENRAIQAAELAIADPHLDDIRFSDASGVLMTVTGGEDSTLFEVDQAATRISQEIDKATNFIFGWVRDEDMTDRLSVSIVVTEGPSNRNANIRD